jgi:hypothetical protein
MGWFGSKRRQQDQEREIARLREHNAQLQARVAELEAENSRLVAQLSAARKHSRTSSKPPSSDIAKLLHKAGQAFGPPHGELLELLPRQTRLNVDETGHKETRQRYWIWCFRAASFVVFKIDRSRGTEVLMRILGEEFQGLLGCDYYAAYRKYARQQRGRTGHALCRHRSPCHPGHTQRARTRDLRATLDGHGDLRAAQTLAVSMDLRGDNGPFQRSSGSFTDSRYVLRTHAVFHRSQPPSLLPPQGAAAKISYPVPGQPVNGYGESTESILADMERSIAANARMLALAGPLNRPHSAGIRM